MFNLQNKSTNQKLCNELKILENENRKLREDLGTIKKEKDRQTTQIEQLFREKKQLDILKDKLEHFKRVFGKIYILKD